MDNADLVSPQFLAHRLRRVLRLLRTHAEDIRTAPVGDVRADRAAFNTVLLCAKLSRNGHLEGEEGVDALLDHAEARLRSDAMVASLVWRPGLVPCLAMATTLLNELGRGDPRFDVLPQAAWDTSFRESSERRPHEVLEARWAARQSGAGDDVRIPDTSLLLRKPFAPMTETADLGAYARRTVPADRERRAGSTHPAGAFRAEFLEQSGAYELVDEGRHRCPGQTDP